MRTLIAGLSVFLLITSNGARAAEAPSGDGMADLAAQAEKRAQEYKDYRPAMPVYSDLDEVQRLADVGRARGRAEFEALSKQTSLVHAGSGAPPAQSTAAAPSVPGLVVVALSSSMPLPMLRDYIAQLDRVAGAVVVLRGFIGGATNVKPTGRWIEEVLREQADCMNCAHRRVRVVVDPLLYKSLGIKQVPAVTYLAGVQDLQHCEKQQFSSASVAYGAVAVEAALHAITKNGVAVPRDVLAHYEGRK